MWKETVAAKCRCDRYISVERLKKCQGSLYPDLNTGSSMYEARVLLTQLPLTYTYLLSYLLTPWSRVLLEKLTRFQLVKKFPAFYGTQMFITAFTSARHLSLS